MKALILDSGPIINLSINGSLYILEKLKQNFDGKFLITHKVKQEIYDRPIGIKQFELSALRVKDLIDKKVLELPESLNISHQALEKETKKITDLANHSIKSKGKWVKIVSEGKMSCLALSSELAKKGIENMIAIDERTARIFCERPKNLQKIISRKIHNEVSLHQENIKKCGNFKFIRSSELVYVAYKKGLTNLKDKKALEAFLYATKFKGSSISFEEIDVLKNS